MRAWSELVAVVAWHFSPEGRRIRRARHVERRRYVADWRTHEVAVRARTAVAK